MVRNARDKACMSALARAIGGVRVVQGGILAAGRGGLHSIEGVPLLDVGVVDPVDPGDLHLRGVRSVREGARRIGVRPGFSALECIIRFGREADSEVSYMVGVGRQSTCSSGPRPGSIGRTAGCSRLVARKVSATEPVHCDSRLVASAVLVRVGVGRQSTCSSGPRPGSIGRTAGCSRLVARKVCCNRTGALRFAARGECSVG